MIKAVDLCNDFLSSVPGCERITAVRMGVSACACIYCMNVYALIIDAQFVDTAETLNLIIPYDD